VSRRFWTESSVSSDASCGRPSAAPSQSGRRNKYGVPGITRNYIDVPGIRAPNRRSARRGITGNKTLVDACMLCKVRNLAQFSAAGAAGWRCRRPKCRGFGRQAPASAGAWGPAARLRCRPLSQPQQTDVRENRMSLGELAFRERIGRLLGRLARPPERGPKPKRPENQVWCLWSSPMTFSLLSSPAPAMIFSGRQSGSTCDRCVGASGGFCGCGQVQMSAMGAGVGMPRGNVGGARR
jgi:hypothetical protein